MYVSIISKVYYRLIWHTSGELIRVSGLVPQDPAGIELTRSSERIIKCPNKIIRHFSAELSPQTLLVI